jgi:hypothetical protein
MPSSRPNGTKVALIIPITETILERITAMALTHTKSRYLPQPSRCYPVPVRTRRPTALVPKARVQEMLREIAFVLHATRRISREIIESMPIAEERPDGTGSTLRLWNEGS